MESVAQHRPLTFPSSRLASKAFADPLKNTKCNDGIHKTTCLSDQSAEAVTCLSHGTAIDKRINNLSGFWRS